mgnify:CR=1 FL=1
MKIVKQVDAPLLSRKRVAIEIEHFGKSTPKKEEIKKEIANLLKTKEELVAIRHIYTKYGYGKSKVMVHVYDKLEDLQRLEKKKVIVKKEKQPKPEAKK